jgi:methanogenic corrinoid protein MtbC1
MRQNAAAESPELANNPRYQIRKMVESSPHPLLRAYVAAQLSGDRSRAVSLVVDAARSGASVQDLQLGVIQAAQREIGRLWEQNEISVAQEHLATGISQFALACLYDLMTRERTNGKRAIVACVEGEHHDLGARMGSDFLEVAGFDVHYLGANVPTKDLVEMIVATRPDVVGLSIAMSSNVPSLVAAVTAIRQAVGDTFPILVGGQAVAWAPELEERLGVLAFGDDALAMITKCREGLGC